MRFRRLFTACLLALFLAGCSGSRHIIGYDISASSYSRRADFGRVCVFRLDDQRPKQERQGLKGKLLSFSSRDKHFDRPVAQAISELLAKELAGAGFRITDKKNSADYLISGSVKHFQAVMAPAKITFLPYLGSVSTLWAKDEFTIALNIYIKMFDQAGNPLIDKTFDVSSDMKLPTGLLSMARYSRGFNYKLKLLDLALKDVMDRIRKEVIARAKK